MTKGVVIRSSASRVVHETSLPTKWAPLQVTFQEVTPLAQLQVAEGSSTARMPLLKHDSRTVCDQYSGWHGLKGKNKRQPESIIFLTENLTVQIDMFSSLLLFSFDLPCVSWLNTRLERSPFGPYPGFQMIIFCVFEINLEIERQT